MFTFPYLVRKISARVEVNVAVGDLPEESLLLQLNDVLNVKLIHFESGG